MYVYGLNIKLCCSVNWNRSCHLRVVEESTTQYAEQHERQSTKAQDACHTPI
jgi:hypothetical protein